MKKIKTLFDQTVTDMRTTEGMLYPLAVVKVDWEDATSTVFIADPTDTDRLYTLIDKIGDPTDTQGISIFDITHIDGLVIDSHFEDEDEDGEMLVYDVDLFELAHECDFYKTVKI
mgnify:CR=1 FL=1